MDHAWKYSLGKEVKSCPRSEVRSVIEKYFLRRRLLIAEPGASHLRIPVDIPQLLETCTFVFARRMRLIAWLSLVVGLLYGTDALIRWWVHRQVDVLNLLMSTMGFLGALLTFYSIRLARRSAAGVIDQLRLSILMQNLRSSDVVGTVSVCACICAIWIAGALLIRFAGWSYEDLVQGFALFPQRVESGQVYRLITGVLMHANLQHLLLNIVGMCVFGSFVEILYGTRTFWLVLVVSTLTGAAGTTLFSPHASVGISGGVYGLAFFLVSVSAKEGRAVPVFTRLSAFISIMVSLAISYVAREKYDVFAHAFGALGGVVLGILHRHAMSRLAVWHPGLPLDSVANTIG